MGLYEEIKKDSNVVVSHNENIKGYTEETEYIPKELQGKTCKCGGKLKYLYVDCETRGDCEIYLFECKSCKDYTSLNYAAEWYDMDEL